MQRTVERIGVKPDTSDLNCTIICMSIPVWFKW